jgi:hypothetical protein
VFPVRYELNLCTHTVYLCVPYGSHKKKGLFFQTVLTCWALLWRRDVFPVRYELELYMLFRRNSVFKWLMDICIVG